MRRSHNRFREENHMGCLERATLAYSAWRKRCKEVATDAEKRAAELIMELASSQERKISDTLINEAVMKQSESLDRAQSRFEARKQSILQECDTKHSESESRNDCVERLTHKAERHLNEERRDVQAKYNTDLDMAVKRAEEKKLQIIAGMSIQRKQARELVLADCAKYLG